MVVGLLLLSTCYVFLINTVSSGMMKVDSWVYHRYWLKNHFAEQIKGPKIIIIGGSSSGIGIDSTMITAETGMPTVNLALHAGMPYDYYTELVERFVKPGDVVVMPLEFQRYGQKIELSSDLAIQLFFSVDPTLQKCLSCSALWQLYAEYGCGWFEKVMKMRQANVERYKKDDTYAEWQKAQLSPTSVSGYHARFVNKCGDCLIPKELACPIKKYHQMPIKISNDFIAFYQEMSRRIHKHGGRFCLTYTNIAFFPMIAEQFSKLFEELKARGIEIWGNPGDFYVPEEYYFDTEYHLNATGAKFFSRNLAKSVNDFIANKHNNKKPLVLSFNHQSANVEFMSGFLSPKAGGILMVGEKAFMRIRNPKFSFEHAVLVFDVRSLVPDKDVYVSVNGKNAGYWHFSQDDSRKRLVVNCSETNNLDIAFSVDSTSCPKGNVSYSDSCSPVLVFKSAEVHAMSCHPSAIVIEAPGADIVSRQWHPVSGIESFDGTCGLCTNGLSRFNVFFPKSDSHMRHLLSLRLQPRKTRTPVLFQVQCGNASTTITADKQIFIRFNVSPEDYATGKIDVSVNEITSQKRSDITSMRSKFLNMNLCKILNSISRRKTMRLIYRAVFPEVAPKALGR